MFTCIHGIYGEVYIFWFVGLKKCVLKLQGGYFWILCPWNKSADHTGGPWTKHYCTDSSQSQLLSSVSWQVYKCTNMYKYKRSWRRMLYSSSPRLIPSPNNAACIKGQHSLLYAYSKRNEREGEKKKGSSAQSTL